MAIRKDLTNIIGIMGCMVCVSFAAGYSIHRLHITDKHFLDLWGDCFNIVSTLYFIWAMLYASIALTRR